MEETEVNQYWKRTYLFFVITCLAVLLVNLLPRFNGFHIMDDAYMFGRYAENLTETGFFSWDGETGAYGATSLLYVITLLPFRLLFEDNPALTVFSGSFFFGILFIAAIFHLVLVELKYPRRFRMLVSGFLWLALATSAKSLMVHFATGMDTTLAMFYGTGFLILLKRWERNPKTLHLLLAAVAGGFAWWVRPDLMVFSLGIPGIGFLAGGSGERKKWLLLGMGIIFSFAACWSLSWLLTGHPVPHAFIAKSTGLYGPAFREAYQWYPAMEFARFLSRNWPVMVMIGITAWLNARIRPAKFSALEWGILSAVTVFFIYHLFFVVPVMGFGQRFWYPALPFLILVAAKGVVNLQDNLKAYSGTEFTDAAPTLGRWLVAVSAGTLLYYGVTGAVRLKNSEFDVEFGIWNAEATYQQRLSDYWYRLDGFSGLPDDLVIATTEVGLPVALNPSKRIVDIAGLNEPDLIYDGGPSAEKVLKKFQPDLIYMPHGHYASLLRSFEQYPPFAEDYYLLKASETETEFDLAILKDSPHIEAMLDLLPD